MLAVEKKSLVRIKADGADAEIRLVLIHHRATGTDARHEPVERRRLDRP